MVRNISPKATFAALQAEAGAQLIDVRTDAEWQYVGIPDLRAIGKQAVLISWQYFPSGNVNAKFVEELRDAGLNPSQPLYFLCRSGVRSLAAGQAAQAAGFESVYNIADGFEGPPDGDGHRSEVAGWKADDLPWRQ